MDENNKINPGVVSTPPTSDVPSIHTYKGDVAEYVKKEGKTMADIAVAESVRTSGRLAEKMVLPERARKARIVVVSVVVLVALSAVVLWLAFGRGEPEPVSPYVSSNFQSRAIFVDGIEEEVITLSEDSGANAMRQVTNSLKANSPFLALYFEEAGKNGAVLTMKSQDFFPKMDIYPPGEFLRSLKDEFALGSIAGRARFMILRTDYYAGAVAGLLKWEKTMEADLRELLDLSLPESTSGMSSTTPSMVKRYTFADLVIDNHDARVLKDGNGNTILVYMFPNNETILITGNLNGARIVAEKLVGVGR